MTGEIAMTTTRRAALCAIPALVTAPLASAAPVTLDQPDPVLAARDAWRETERVMDAAYDRAEAMKRPPYPREHLGTVRDLNEPGGIREIYATDLHALTPAAEKQGALIGQDFAGEMPEAERREKYERLRAALEKRDRAVAALEDRAGLTVARQAAQDAHRAFLDTPATTPAGITAKLRAIDTDYTDEPEIDAALRDLDRADTPRIAAQGHQRPTGADQATQAYARATAASKAYNAASAQVEARHAAPGAAYEADLDALEAGPIGREHDAAWIAALEARAITLPGLAAKARIVANAQGIPTDRPTDRACDAVMLTLIEDLDRMAGDAT